LRLNDRIQAEQVRLIIENGENIGVVDLTDALTMAAEANLDLVEVAPDASPPVCRVMDYGKQKYRHKKRQHQGRSKQHQAQLKSLRLGPAIEEHDIQVKLRRARTFLERGDRVTFNMMFRGRQMLHREKGHEVLNRIAEELEDIAKVELPPKSEGRRIWMVLAPK